MASQVSNAGPRPEERAIRVEDYLNDKLQTHADLENLDILLETVRSQQALLREQLSQAESKLEKARSSSDSHARSLLDHMESFHRQQAIIDQRLLMATDSQSVEDAVRKFHTSMEKLGRFDVAKGYVDLLAEVEHLSSEARQNFKGSPEAALRPYLQLQNLAIALKRAQPAAEDAAPHLVDHVDEMAQNLWQQMKDAFAADFENTLKKAAWPGKEFALSGSLEREWADGVERLLQLQEPELLERDRDGNQAHQLDPLVLLPLEVMARPLEMRFRYHFESDRPTNRLDKPEYFFSHVASLLETYDEFFAIYLQPILQRHFKSSHLSLNPLYVDSTSAFITALLPMVRHKIQSFLPQVSTQPQLLSHAIHELMSFDTSLKENWDYDGGCGADGWKGLTWEVLVRQDWFGRWLQVEKDFALARYHDIIQQAESGEIDYDSMDPGSTKPTKAAIRVNDLLETVTDRYRPLASFSQKLRFLLDIQVAIFDQFHDRLHSSLEAYLAATSSLARTVHGRSKDEQAQLQGLGGLDRLCRVYGSAEYLEKKMRDWSDDVFFLELWDELQVRARHGGQGQGHLGGMSLEDVAGRTSSAVGSDADSGALFDETAGAYQRLRVRTEGLVHERLSHDVREALRPYGRIHPWSLLASEPASAPSATADSLAPSAELDPATQLLSSHLAFLARALAEAPLRRIARHVGLTVQSFLWDSVIMRHSFTEFGIVHLQRDVAVIVEAIDRHVGAGQAETSMRKICEAMELLALPVVGDRDAAAWDDTETEAMEDETADGTPRWNLWDVEKRLFKSNESAREVLDELGLDILTEQEARAILERRVELGS